MKRAIRCSTGLLVAMAVVLGGCARHEVEPRRAALRAELARPAGSPRRIYPYSLIPGGVSGEEEFQAHRVADPILTAHYRGIGERLLPTTAPADRWLFASYRIDDTVYWTKSRVLLHAGEAVLTDGTNLVRGRCGNRLSETPQQPVRRFEPPGIGTDHPLTTPGIPQPPSLTPVPGQPVRLPALIVPPPAGPALVGPGSGPTLVAPPLTQPPLEQPTEIALFPPLTEAPGVLLPLPPRTVPPARGRPTPPVLTPPERPVSAVPEPGTANLFSAGFVLLGIWAAVQAIRPRLLRRDSSN